MIEKIDDIRDEIEGQQLRAILREQGIPHHLRSYHDSAYDGLFQVQLGWGYVEAPAAYRGQRADPLAGHLLQTLEDVADAEGGALQNGERHLRSRGGRGQPEKEAAGPGVPDRHALALQVREVHQAP